jgi:hypothetical protein
MSYLDLVPQSLVVITAQTSTHCCALREGYLHGTGQVLQL